MSGYTNSVPGTAGTVVQVGAINGVLNVATLEESARQVRRLVLAVASVFRDREDAMAHLDTWAEQMAAGGSRLWVISGRPGIGKTSLAMRWINQNTDRFSYAQIALECGGGPGEGHGRRIEEVCDTYFAKVGVDPGAAVTPEAKMRLLSSLIDGQPVVVLLDDVRSVAQIMPFLSTSASVLIVVTSTVPWRELGRFGARVLDLAPLPDGAMREVFEEIVGTERTSAEPEALAALVRTCAGLPLLAMLAAELLSYKRYLRLTDLARRMTDQGRLAALETGNDEGMGSPSAVFEVMYGELSPPAARLYRAIGLHPVRDFDPGLVTALFAERPSDGVAALEELRKRGIVRFDQRGRYLMEDLTYEHAGRAAVSHDDAGDRNWIRRRIADYYLRGAVAASRLLSQRWTLGPVYDQEPPFPLPDFRAGTDSGNDEGGVDPVSWTRENLPAIMACMQRAGQAWDAAGPIPGYQWQMAEATNGYFTREGPSDERETILRWAAEDAAACHDADAQARIQAQWGEMLLGQWRLNEAEEKFQRSLQAAEGGREYRGRGAALEWLGVTELRRGQGARALEYLDRAKPLLDPDRPRSQALWAMHRGEALALVGEQLAAMESYLAAARLFREWAAGGERDRVNEGKVLLGQGKLLTDSEPDRARPLLEEALELFRTERRSREQAEAWEALGDLGDGVAAWQTAFDLFERLGWETDAARVRAKLQR